MSQYVFALNQNRLSKYRIYDLSDVFVFRNQKLHQVFTLHFFNSTANDTLIVIDLS